VLKLLPTLLILLRSRSVGRRVGDDAGPMEGLQVALVVVCDMAVDNKEIFPPIIIEVEKIATPGPAPIGGSGTRGRLLERSISLIAIERVALREALQSRAHGRGSLLLKARVPPNSQSRCAPDFGNVHIHLAIVVIVAPRNTHPGAAVLQAGARRHVGKGSVTIVPIKIVRTEIV